MARARRFSGLRAVINNTTEGAQAGIIRVAPEAISIAAPQYSHTLQMRIGVVPKEQATAHEAGRGEPESVNCACYTAAESFA